MCVGVGVISAVGVVGVGDQRGGGGYPAVVAAAASHKSVGGGGGGSEFKCPCTNGIFIELLVTGIPQPIHINVGTRRPAK